MNNKGFGVVEIILIIVLVGVLGFVGYRAYDVYTSKTDEGREQNKYGFSKDKEDEDAEEATKDSTEYLTIEEWGVKVPIENVDNLSYEIEDNIAHFRSTKLNSVSGDCKSNSLDVARGKAADTYPATIEESTFAEAYTDLQKEEQGESRNYSTKIGDYYYLVPGYSGAACGNSEAETEALLEIANALESLEAK